MALEVNRRGRNYARIIPFPSRQSPEPQTYPSHVRGGVAPHGTCLAQLASLLRSRRATTTASLPIKSPAPRRASERKVSDKPVCRIHSQSSQALIGHFVHSSIPVRKYSSLVFIDRRSVMSTRNVALSSSECAAWAAQERRPLPFTRPIDIPSVSGGAPDERGAGRRGGEDEEEHGERGGGEVEPPHVLMARRRAAFSVCSGQGRTLKGRDLTRTRDSVLRMTGFIEG